MTNLLHELRCFTGGELGNRAADEIERQAKLIDHLVEQSLAAEGKVIEYRELLDGYHTMVQQTVQIHADCQPFTIETVSAWLDTQGLTAVSKADAEAINIIKQVPRRGYMRATVTLDGLTVSIELTPNDLMIGARRYFQDRCGECFDNLTRNRKS